MKVLITFFSALLFSACSGVFFYPDQHTYALPSDYNLTYEEHTIISADKTRLHSWHIKPHGPSKGLMVVAHGNAQNISAHFKGWVWLVQAGYDLFIFDYRAYGKSQGEISIKGSVEDVNAALDFVEKHFEQDYFVCGQSLGGTLSLAAVASKPRKGIKAMIIDSTFTAFDRIVAEKLSSFFLTWPFQWIPHLSLPDGYDAVQSLAKIDKPLLFVHGSKDQAIPANHSWQLFDLAPRPKEFWLVTEAPHIAGLNHIKVREDFLNFLEKVDQKVYYTESHSLLKIYH